MTKRTLPGMETPSGNQTRGDTYINNIGRIFDNIIVVSRTIENLHKQNEINIDHLMTLRKRLNERKFQNHPLTPLLQDIIDILLIQAGVQASKLGVISNSNTIILEASEENKQIVDENLTLPTGLESKMTSKLQGLIDQQSDLANLIIQFLNRVDNE